MLIPKSCGLGITLTAADYIFDGPMVEPAVEQAIDRAHHGRQNYFYLSPIAQGTIEERQAVTEQ